jgi:hypothetical protein
LPDPGLYHLGVLTRGRADAVRRCVDSFLTNSADHGRALACSVVDTSAEPAARACTWEGLRRLRQRADCQIRYADLRDKQTFAQRLAQRAGVDPAIVQFGLADPHDCGHDTGANRNTLLLAHAGWRFISADDDVVCEPRAPVDPAEGLVLSGKGDATEVRLFPDPGSALAHYQRAPGSALAAHEQLLGRSPRECAIPAHPSIVLDSLSRSALADWRQPDARVAVTMTGVLGDCGARYPSYYLWRNAGMRTQLVAAGETSYRRLASSRQVARFVRTATISSSAFLMTTSCAFDARTLLPPFFPVMRGQDLNFGRLLRLCFRQAFIGHLPLMLPHLPVDHRDSRQALFPPAEHPSLHFVVRHALELFADLGQSNQTASARLRLLGRRLQELARLPPSGLAEVLAGGMQRTMDRRLAALRVELEQADHQPAFWARDLAAYLDSRQPSEARAEGLLPSDLHRGRSADQTRALLAELLRQYGALLEAWPALFEAAVWLNLSGQELGRSV